MDHLQLLKEADHALMLAQWQIEQLSKTNHDQGLRLRMFDDMLMVFHAKISGPNAMGYGENPEHFISSIREKIKISFDELKKPSNAPSPDSH